MRQNKINVDINFQNTQQTIEGWGSSLCWWTGQVGNWENSRVDSLIELITSPDCLNMNIFRYNIGGGDDPAHIGGHMVKGKGKRAEMEGFKATPNAPYNWKADEAQRLIMLKIKEKRPDAIFEAFSNSPPYWMTISGCSAGNIDPKKDNLKPEFYEAFCDYLIDVCKHYKDEYGIEFKTLEPSYSGTNEQRVEVKNLVEATGKTFWQSETGPGGWKEKAGGFRNDLLLARKMFDDLNLMQPQAWLDWQLMEENNDVWGLIRCNFKTQKYDIVKNLYVRMQVTRFFRQGYTLVSTDYKSALAAISPDKTELVVAINNTSDTIQAIHLNFSSFPETASSIQLFRTSTTEK
ncbi:MAG: hypothetical protein J7L95_00100 [Prolixibacteraceae bacterium]|nr:hypothetical protein [Prolixibacteraceae bacterium]